MVVLMLRFVGRNGFLSCNCIYVSQTDNIVITLGNQKCVTVNVPYVKKLKYYNNN